MERSRELRDGLAGRATTIHILVELCGLQMRRNWTIIFWAFFATAICLINATVHVATFWGASAMEALPGLNPAAFAEPIGMPPAMWIFIFAMASMGAAAFYQKKAAAAMATPDSKVCGTLFPRGKWLFGLCFIYLLFTLITCGCCLNSYHGQVRAEFGSYVLIYRDRVVRDLSRQEVVQYGGYAIRIFSAWGMALSGFAACFLFKVSQILNGPGGRSNDAVVA
jgi:hypothetical protein